MASSERPGVGNSHAARWPIPRPARRRIFSTHSSAVPAIEHWSISHSGMSAAARPITSGSTE